jgi:hypothetical protein
MALRISPVQPAQLQAANRRDRRQYNSPHASSPAPAQHAHPHSHRFTEAAHRSKGTQPTTPGGPSVSTCSNLRLRFDLAAHNKPAVSLSGIPFSLACLPDLWHAKTKQELNASTRRTTGGYRYSRPRSWGSSVENSVNTPCMVAGPEPVTRVLMYCIVYVLNLCTLVSQLLTLSRRIYLMFCLTACLIHIYLYRGFRAVTIHFGFFFCLQHCPV